MSGVVEKVKGKVSSLWERTQGLIRDTTSEMGYRTILQQNLYVSRLKGIEELEEKIHKDPLGVAHSVKHLAEAQLAIADDTKFQSNVRGFVRAINWYEENVVNLYFSGDHERLKKILNNDISAMLRKVERGGEDTLMDGLTKGDLEVVMSETNDLKKYIRFMLTLVKKEDKEQRPVVMYSPQMMGPMSPMIPERQRGRPVTLEG